MLVIIHATVKRRPRDDRLQAAVGCLYKGAPLPRSRHHLRDVGAWLFPRVPVEDSIRNFVQFEQDNGPGCMRAVHYKATVSFSHQEAIELAFLSRRADHRKA